MAAISRFYHFHAHPSRELVRARLPRAFSGQSTAMEGLVGRLCSALIEIVLFTCTVLAVGLLLLVLAGFTGLLA